MLDSIFESIIAGVTGTALLSVASFLVSRRFRLWTRRATNYLFDTKMQVDLRRVDRYDSTPVGELDLQFFKRLQDTIPGITFESLDNGKLRIQSDKLTSQLEIRLEECVNFSRSGSEPRYEMRVESFTPITFGYRSDQCLREFERISEDISSEMQQSYFDVSPTAKFVTGTLHGQMPIVQERIEDESVRMRAKRRDSTLEMTFDDPRYVSQGIRKYFRPI